MNAKPVVGINMDFRPKRDNNPSFGFLYAGYFDAVIKAGGIPMALPPLDNEDDLNQVLNLVDAVILTGGGDLDPRNDGFMTHPAQRLLDPRREKSDRKLAELCFERRISVFGIGAGMQLLNVSQGGNLFFHIPEDLPHALPHHDVLDKSHRHSLDVEHDSLMGSIYGEGEIRVNSVHHMAIDELAPGFRVTARCPDGVVEAIESTRNDWFAIGTQFHPEAESASALDQRIFEEFIDGARRMQAQPEMRLVA